MLKYLPLLLLFINCVNKQENRIKDKDTATATVESTLVVMTETTNDTTTSGSDALVKQLVEDTIKWFYKKQSFVIKEREGFAPLTIKGFVVDGQKFVAATVLGQYLVLYKYIDTAYIRIFYSDDAGMNPLNVKVKFMDINFDGYNDVLICDRQGVWGNEFSTTFLYNKASQTFNRTSFLDLRNLTLDKKNKFLRTHSYRGAAWVRDKSIYRFVNDTIELTGEAWYIPHESNHDDSLATLKVYLYQNGAAKDSTVQKTKNAWELYLKALWDNSKDYD